MVYFLLIWFGLGLTGGLCSTLPSTWRRSGVDIGDKITTSFEASDIVQCLLFTLLGFFGLMMGLAACLLRKEREKQLKNENRWDV